MVMRRVRDASEFFLSTVFNDSQFEHADRVNYLSLNFGPAILQCRKYAVKREIYQSAGICSNCSPHKENK